MVGIVPGQNASANEVMNAIGSMFNDTAQNIFNADYIGFDSRLTNSTTPNLKNLLYSTFTSDDADVVTNFIYDSTNDLYHTVAPAADFGTHYIIIEATSFGTWGGGNDTLVQKVDDGKWVVWCDTGTDAVKRAQIHKSLWFGTTGADQLIEDFATITRIATSTTRDVGMRATYCNQSQTSGGIANAIGTFADTSTNQDCSSWSKLNTGNVDSANWAIPDGTTKHSIGVNTSSDELGTDREGDEEDNPADCDISCSRNNSVQANVVILHSGTISWSSNWTTTDVQRDFVTDATLPGAMTAVSGTEWDVSTLIFKNTVSSTDNAIAIINSQIDATSSEQISISANGGSNYTDVNNAEIARPTAGTALWRKIVITRTDLSKEDKVTEQAVKHSFY